MVDEAQEKIQSAMTSLVDDLDRSFLRSMQRVMHLCAASCCEKKELSVDQIHNCIERCSIPLKETQNFIQKELSQFQVAVFKGEFETCAMQCVNDHIKLIPSTKKRIADVLEKKS